MEPCSRMGEVIPVARQSRRPSRRSFARKYAKTLGTRSTLLHTRQRRVAVTRGASRWHYSSRQRSQSPLDAQCMAATRLPARPFACLSTSFHSSVVAISSHHGILGLDIFLRRASPYRSRDERERSHLQACQDEVAPSICMSEQRLGHREGARYAAPMYPARVKSRAIAHDTCARMKPRASL